MNALFKSVLAEPAAGVDPHAPVLDGSGLGGSRAVRAGVRPWCAAGMWLGLALLGSVAAASAFDLTPLESLAIQDGGRKKPLDTYARESLQKLVGRATWKKSDTERLTAMQVVASMLLSEQDWEHAPVIRVDYEPLKKRLGLPERQRFFTVAELRTNDELKRIIDDMRRRRTQSANPEFNRLENEAGTLANKLLTWQELVTAAGLRIIPHPSDPKGNWVTPREARAYYPERAAAVGEAFEAVVGAYRQQDSARLAEAVAQFKSLMRSLAPNVYPTEKELSTELHFNHLHPFRQAWIIYLLAFGVLLLASREGLGLRRKLYWPGVAIFAAGLVMQVYGFVLRCMIAGRPPVTNMYEVMIWVPFGAALFAIIFELIYRPRYFALAASAVGTLSLVLADNLPAVLDPSIKPLVPVLMSNYWLTVHVLTINLGYAGFMLALGLGHIVLWNYLFRPHRRDTIKQLTQFNYRAMQVGLLFLTAGTILGGVWANDSWGRFWGWDPKETWALIAILCYLVVLHGRFSGWMGDFALNVASVLCFQAIIFAAYGVNFVLGKGLHSYGFGVGGEKWVGLYVALELLLVGLAVWRYKLQAPRLAPETAAAATASKPGAKPRREAEREPAVRG
jgi:cytochrome c-type biogenesis protein CcsB